MNFEEIRFCRVCMELEESHSNELTSIFSENANVAKIIYNLTGIQPIDVVPKVPSLVCERCKNELKSAELLRRRILDCNEYLTRMTREKEIEMLESELQKLQKQFSENLMTNSAVDMSFEGESHPKVEMMDFDDGSGCQNINMSLSLFLDHMEGPIKHESFETNSWKNSYPTKCSDLKEENCVKIESRKFIEEEPKSMIEINFTKNHECGSCGQILFSRKQLDQHLETHHQVKAVKKEEEESVIIVSDPGRDAERNVIDLC